MRVYADMCFFSWRHRGRVSSKAILMYLALICDALSLRDALRELSGLKNAKFCACYLHIDTKILHRESRGRIMIFKSRISTVRVLQCASWNLWFTCRSTRFFPSTLLILLASRRAPPCIYVVTSSAWGKNNKVIEAPSPSRQILARWVASRGIIMKT